MHAHMLPLLQRTRNSEDVSARLVEKETRGQLMKPQCTQPKAPPRLSKDEHQKLEERCGLWTVHVVELAHAVGVSYDVAWDTVRSLLDSDSAQYSMVSTTDITDEYLAKHYFRERLAGLQVLADILSFQECDNPSSFAAMNQFRMEFLKNSGTVALLLEQLRQIHARTVPESRVEGSHAVPISIASDHAAHEQFLVLEILFLVVYHNADAVDMDALMAAVREIHFGRHPLFPLMSDDGLEFVKLSRHLVVHILQAVMRFEELPELDKTENPSLTPSKIINMDKSFFSHLNDVDHDLLVPIYFAWGCVCSIYAQHPAAAAEERKGLAKVSVKYLNGAYGAGVQPIDAMHSAAKELASNHLVQHSTNVHKSLLEGLVSALPLTPVWATLRQQPGVIDRATALLNFSLTDSTYSATTFWRQLSQKLSDDPARLLDHLCGQNPMLAEATFDVLHQPSRLMGMLCALTTDTYSAHSCVQWLLSTPLLCTTIPGGIRRVGDNGAVAERDLPLSMSSLCIPKGCSGRIVACSSTTYRVVWFHRWSALAHVSRQLDASLQSLLSCTRPSESDLHMALASMQYLSKVGSLNSSAFEEASGEVHRSLGSTVSLYTNTARLVAALLTRVRVDDSNRDLIWQVTSAACNLLLEGAKHEVQQQVATHQTPRDRATILHIVQRHLPLHVLQRVVDMETGLGEYPCTIHVVRLCQCFMSQYVRLVADASVVKFLRQLLHDFVYRILLSASFWRFRTSLHRLRLFHCVCEALFSELEKNSPFFEDLAQSMSSSVSVLTTLVELLYDFTGILSDVEVAHTRVARGSVLAILSVLRRLIMFTEDREEAEAELSIEGEGKESPVREIIRVLLDVSPRLASHGKGGKRSSIVSSLVCLLRTNMSQVVFVSMRVLSYVLSHSSVNLSTDDIRRLQQCLHQFLMTDNRHFYEYKTALEVVSAALDFQPRLAEYLVHATSAYSLDDQERKALTEHAAKDERSYAALKLRECKSESIIDAIAKILGEMHEWFESCPSLCVMLLQVLHQLWHEVGGDMVARLEKIPRFWKLVLHPILTPCTETPHVDHHRKDADEHKHDDDDEDEEEMDTAASNWHTTTSLYCCQVDCRALAYSILSRHLLAVPDAAALHADLRTVLEEVTTEAWLEEHVADMVRIEYDPFLLTRLRQSATRFGVNLEEFRSRKRESGPNFAYDVDSIEQKLAFQTGSGVANTHTQDDMRGIGAVVRRNGRRGNVAMLNETLERSLWHPHTTSAAMLTDEQDDAIDSREQLLEEVKRANCLMSMTFAHNSLTKIFCRFLRVSLHCKHVDVRNAFPFLSHACGFLKSERRLQSGAVCSSVMRISRVVLQLCRAPGAVTQLTQHERRMVLSALATSLETQTSFLRGSHSRPQPPNAKTTEKEQHTSPLHVLLSCIAVLLRLTRPLPDDEVACAAHTIATRSILRNLSTILHTVAGAFRPSFQPFTWCPTPEAALSLQSAAVSVAGMLLEWDAAVFTCEDYFDGLLSHLLDLFASEASHASIKHLVLRCCLEVLRCDPSSTLTSMNGACMLMEKRVVLYMCNAHVLRKFRNSHQTLVEDRPSYSVWRCSLSLLAALVKQLPPNVRFFQEAFEFVSVYTAFLNSALCLDTSGRQRLLTAANLEEITLVCELLLQLLSRAADVPEPALISATVQSLKHFSQAVLVLMERLVHYLVNSSIPLASGSFAPTPPSHPTSVAEADSNKHVTWGPVTFSSKAALSAVSSRPPSPSSSSLATTATTPTVRHEAKDAPDEEQLAITAVLGTLRVAMLYVLRLSNIVGESVFSAAPSTYSPSHRRPSRPHAFQLPPVSSLLNLCGYLSTRLTMPEVHALPLLETSLCVLFFSLQHHAQHLRSLPPSLATSMDASMLNASVTASISLSMARSHTVASQLQDMVPAVKRTVQSVSAHTKEHDLARAVLNKLREWCLSQEETHTTVSSSVLGSPAPSHTPVRTPLRRTPASRRQFTPVAPFSPFIGTRQG